MNTALKAVRAPAPKENCNQVVVTVEEQKAVETCVQKDVERCEVNYNTVRPPCISVMVMSTTPICLELALNHAYNNVC